MANIKILANGTLNGPITNSATSVPLDSGQGARMPAVPFKITVTPKNEASTIDNSEVMLVTARSTDTMTVVRAQNGTTAKAFADDAFVAVGVYVEDVMGTDVTVTTAAATAAKVGTTTAGNYVPTYGDQINVTFTLGCNVANPTLNIDGSGAKNIQLGNVNVSTAFVGTTSALKLKMWYDGTVWQIYGSLKNDNTTYTEISDVEAANASSSTARLISGRRLQTALTAAFAAVAGFVRSTTTANLTVSTTAPASPTVGDVWFDTNDLPEELAPSSIVWKETPTGTVNGTNTNFATSQAYVSGSLQVFINGLAESGLVTETAPGSGGFTLSPAPLTGDNLSVQYQVRTTATGNADTVDNYHANATPTANTIPVLDASGKLPNSAVNSNIYSNTETPIGVWVDGSTIYRKAWQKNGAADFPLAHGVTGMNRLLKLQVAIRDDTNTSYRMLPWLYSLSDAGWVAGVYLNSTSIIFQDVGDTAIDNFTQSYVVIEYTKT